MKKITAIALLLALASAGGAAAQELAQKDAARIAFWEEGLAKADPAIARAVKADKELLEKLARIEPDKASDIKSKAEALLDLEAQLEKDWGADKARNLSGALAVRLTRQGPLAKIGLAPSPEKTIEWAAKYKTYGADKTALIAKAVKNWDAVFGSCVFVPFVPPGTSYTASWTVNTSSGALFMKIGPSDLIFAQSEAGIKAEWERFILKDRNSFLNAKATAMLNAFFVDGSTRTDAAAQQRLLGNASFEFLDASGKGRLDRYVSQMRAAEEVKARLSASQMATLSAKTVEEQMLELGRMFDKKEATAGKLAERNLDANRPSRPDETLSAQNNELIAGMLRSSLVSEVKGNPAGDKVAAFYAGGAKLNLAIETCQGCHAKYEPSSGRIVLDSELVQQYLRANNMSADDLVKSKDGMAGLAKYVSPIFVHEATHQMQHSWADKAGIYKPYTQEDEIEALSMEGMYTTAKRKTDPRFRYQMVTMAKGSSYAQQRVEVAKKFENNQKEFGDFVRQQYYYGVPSFDAASSQVLSAVSGELTRRATLSPTDLAEINDYGKDLQEVRRMSAQEIADSVTDIKTSALRSVQADLMNGAAYTEHYAGAEQWSVSMRKAGAASKRRAVPAV
jgi:hypothetical protein